MPDQAVDRLPPTLRTTNWPRGNETTALEGLVRAALERNGESIGDRLGASASSAAVALLVEESLLPSPKPLNLVPIFPVGLPRSIGTKFVGRGDDLWRLHYALSGSGTGEPVGLTGSIEALGGMGKTRLAIEYVHRFAAPAYPGGVFWVNGDVDEAEIELQLHGILAMLEPATPSLRELRESRVDVRDVLARVVQRLHNPVLFVVDNLPEPTGLNPVRALDYWCPAIGSVSLLVTSRARVSVGSHGITPLNIDALNSDAAVLLLTEGIDRAALPEDEWRATSEWVGRLPLALELLNRVLKAGAVAPSELPDMRSAGITPQLESGVRALRPFVSEGALRGVTETFEVSYSRLPPDAQILAIVLAELGPAPIPLELLSLWGPLASRRARANLVMRSFVTPAESSGVPLYGSIHRVLADFLRSKTLDRTLPLDTWCGALNRLFDRFVEGEPANWPLLNASAPHVQYVVEERLARGASEAALILGWHLGRFWLSRGVPQPAFELLSRISGLTEKTLGRTHDGTLECKHAVAEAAIALGRPTVARTHFEGFADACGERFGREHPRTLVALTDVGAAMNAEGHFEQAREMIQRSVDLLRERHQTTDRDLAGVLSNLGLVLISLGRYDEAVTVLERALPHLIELSSERSSTTQACMVNLGQALRATGDKARGTGLWRRVHEVRQTELGPSHPLTIRSLHNLAAAIAEDGQLQDAIATERLALASSMETLGPNHRETIASKGQLGRFLTRAGALDEAEILVQSVADMFGRLAPATHPDVIASKSDLAEVLQRKGELAEAEELYWQTLSLSLQTYGPKHPASAWSFHKLLSIMETRGIPGIEARRRVESSLPEGITVEVMLDSLDLLIPRRPQGETDTEGGQ